MVTYRPVVGIIPPARNCTLVFEIDRNGYEFPIHGFVCEWAGPEQGAKYLPLFCFEGRMMTPQRATDILKAKDKTVTDWKIVEEGS